MHWSNKFICVLFDTIIPLANSCHSDFIHCKVFEDASAFYMCPRADGVGSRIRLASNYLDCNCRNFVNIYKNNNY